ncbi:hypothetical protein [Geodermatophilus sp. URMC 63]
MDEQRINGDGPTKSWEDFHAEHLDRQTNALQSIKTYVALWFWLSLLGVLFIFLAAQSSKF